jgi:DNA sulfur modification protein DndD
MTTLKRTNEQIEEIRQALGNQNDNSVRELEDRRNNLNISRDEYLVQIGKLRERLPQIEKIIADLQGEIEALTDDEEAAQTAQRQVRVIDDCIEMLKQILTAETAELIPALEAEINKHFAQSINQVGYQAKIDDNFRINVVKSSGEVVARNQALRQALSLCFIGSLIELSRRRAEVPTILQGLAGTVYPVVMDSPFGAMDNETRKATARIMPELANQVVAMISSSQYEGGVDEVFKQTHKIGKRYYLRYHNTKFTGERASRSMTIDGQNLQLFKEDTFEHTQIIEIS